MIVPLAAEADKVLELGGAVDAICAIVAVELVEDRQSESTKPPSPRLLTRTAEAAHLTHGPLLTIIHIYNSFTFANRDFLAGSCTHASPTSVAFALILDDVRGL